MKKKIICSAAAAAMCLFSFGYIAECAAEDAAAPAAQAAEEQFKDGEDYFTINAEKTAQPEIKEFFSPYCSHCMAFEDITARLRKDEPKAAFVRSPVAFMGGDMAAEMQKVVEGLSGCCGDCSSGNCGGGCGGCGGCGSK